MQMIEAYNEGLKEFNKVIFFLQLKNLMKLNFLYPQSIWAPRSNLMAAYAFLFSIIF